MKIAFAATSHLPSTAANSVQVMKMCEAFAGAGHQVELFARPSDKRISTDQIFADYGVKKLFGINFVTAPTMWGAGGVIYGCKVAARLLSGSFKPDIIYGRNLYSLLACSLSGAKLYYESHAAPANTGRQLLERILFSLPGFRRLIVINRALHNYYLQTCPQLAASQRISTLIAPDGATPLVEPAALSASPNDSEIVIGYAGGLYPGKGLEIITRLAQAMPQFTFRIAGGSEGEIAAWKSSCPAKNLYFTGFLNHTAIGSFLSSCTILLAPYQTKVSTNPEGLGNIADWMSPLKIFEYMASGRPIVAAQLPAIEEILTDRVNARLVAPADIAAWCRVIKELAADRQQQKRLAENAAAEFAARYTWSARARRVLAPEPLSARVSTVKNLTRSDKRISGPVKCLHIIGDLNSGGAEKMLCRLVKNSDKAVFEHRIITLFETGSLAPELEEAKIRVFNLGMARGLTAISAFPRLTQIIRKLQPDLVQTWMYYAGSIGPLAVRAAGSLPIINSIRHGGFINDSFKTVVSARIAAMVARTIKSRLVACSAAALEAHRQIGFPTGEALIIPNGFILPERPADKEGAASLRRQLGLAENVPVVGWVGRDNPAKDPENFIRAAAKVAAALPETHFIMCGRGITAENTTLKAAIDRAGTGNCLHLLGHCDDIAPVMRGLTVLVSSSITEAFANVVGEAMALAVPCVVTDVGDSAHIVGDTGIIVPPSNSARLAEGIHKVVALSESRREELGQKARARIEKLFALSGVVKQYEKLYLEVTDEQRKN